MTSGALIDFIARHWGDVASVVGLALSTVGFLLTILISRRTASAATAAAKAATSTRNSLFHFNAVVETSQSISVLAEIMRYHRSEQWNYLPERYSAIRALLVSVKSPSSTLQEPQKLIVASVLQQLNGIDAKVEASIQSGKTTGPARAGALIEILKEQSDHLTELLALLKQGGGDPNGRQ